MRARQPERCGYAVRDGVRLYYEVFGDGPSTVLLLPPWSIVQGRVWKLQVPFLARQFRVVTSDPRGSGRSDGPQSGPAYDDGADRGAPAVHLLPAGQPLGAAALRGPPPRPVRRGRAWTMRTSPADLAAEMLAAGRSRPAYRPVRRGRADKVAAMLAGLLTGPRG